MVVGKRIDPHPMMNIYNSGLIKMSDISWNIEIDKEFRPVHIDIDIRDRKVMLCLYKIMDAGLKNLEKEIDPEKDGKIDPELYMLKGTIGKCVNW